MDLLRMVSFTSCERNEMASADVSYMGSSESTSESLALFSQFGYWSIKHEGYQCSVLTNASRTMNWSGVRSYGRECIRDESGESSPIHQRCGSHGLGSAERAAGEGYVADNPFSWDRQVIIHYLRDGTTSLPTCNQISRFHNHKLICMPSFVTG